jgi:hypothetical protein
MRCFPSVVFSWSSLLLEAIALHMRYQLMLVLSSFPPHAQQRQPVAPAAAVAVQHLQQTKLGVALYMHASVPNHSCAPTAAVRFEDRSIVVAATEPLAKGDPIEVSHSFEKYFEKYQRLFDTTLNLTTHASVSSGDAARDANIACAHTVAVLIAAPAVSAVRAMIALLLLYGPICACR